jgi:hypothetical protein
LVLKWSIRTNYTATSGSVVTTELDVCINSNAYTPSNTYLYGNGSSAGSARQTSSQASALVSWTSTNQAQNTSNTFSNGEMYIPNYASSNSKVASSFSATEDNSTGGAVISATAALEATSTAITSLLIFAGYGSFVAGSSFYLYGIKNS